MSLVLEGHGDAPGRALFWGLAVSLALHGSAVAVVSQTRAAPSALVAAGGGGQSLESLEAMQATFVDLAPEIRPPAPRMAPPPNAPVIEIPQPSPPDLAPPPPETPKIAAEKALAEPERPTPRKEEKPKQAKPAPPQTESRAASRAAGAGEAAQAGSRRQDPQATLAEGRAKSRLSEWGATIRSRIERRKSYPGAAGGASGPVGLSLTVSREGALIAAAVGRSSGNAALDAAALAAVRRAGGFPAAPQGLTKPSYAFTLTINFSR